jgi:hypothetical protein
MADIVVSGNSSGSVTLRAPDVSGTTILTLPTTSGTLVTTAGGSTGSFTTLTSSGASSFATSSGNVGIGTGSPTVKLDVRGNELKIYDSATSNVNLSLRNSTTGDAAGFGLQQDGVNTILYNGSNGYMSFYTNTAERMRITSSGFVGINTASPDGRLQISGDSSVGGGTPAQVRLYDTYTGGSASRNWLIGNALGTAGYGDLTFMVSSTQGGNPVSGTNNVIFRSTGALVLQGGTAAATGTGIAFPATQSASSDANTLDDYEQGTWTPAFVAASGSATYTNQQGTYTKIGRQVTAVFYITVNTSSSLVANGISGLPFTGSSTNYVGTSFSVWSGIGGYCNVIGLTGAATTIQIRSTNSATSAPVLNSLTVSNGAEIAGTVTYFTAD